MMHGRDARETCANNEFGRSSWKWELSRNPSRRRADRRLLPLALALLLSKYLRLPDEWREWAAWPKSRKLKPEILAIFLDIGRARIHGRNDFSSRWKLIEKTERRLVSCRASCIHTRERNRVANCAHRRRTSIFSFTSIVFDWKSRKGALIFHPNIINQLRNFSINNSRVVFCLKYIGIYKKRRGNWNVFYGITLRENENPWKKLMIGDKDYKVRNTRESEKQLKSTIEGAREKRTIARLRSREKERDGEWHRAWMYHRVRVVAHPRCTGRYARVTNHDYFGRLSLSTAVLCSSLLTLLLLSLSLSLTRRCIDHLRYPDARTKYIFYGHTRDYRQSRRERNVGLLFKAHPNNPLKVIEWVFSWSKFRRRALFFFSKNAHVSQRTATIDVNRQTLCTVQNRSWGSVRLDGYNQRKGNDQSKRRISVFARFWGNRRHNNIDSAVNLDAVSTSTHSSPK